MINKTKTIPMGALKLAAEIEKIFVEIMSLEDLDFNYKRETNNDIKFSKEQIDVIEKYNLDEILRNCLQEENKNKRLSNFTSAVKKEDRKIVYTAILKEDFSIKIPNMTHLNVFAYKPICPVCKNENKTIHKVDRDNTICESCGHVASWHKLCKCNFCNEKWNKLEGNMRDFFTFFGNEYKLTNRIHELNSFEDANIFISLIKKSFSDSVEDDFVTGNNFEVERKEFISDYKNFLNLYNKIGIVIIEEQNMECKQILVKIDKNNNVLIKFDNNGKFISQKLKKTK